MTPQTLADVTPGGAATPITASTAEAIWVTVSAPKGNAGDIRVGDSNVGAARGAAVAPDSSFTFVRGASDQRTYVLSKIYVYGTSTDKATITYASA